MKKLIILALLTLISCGQYPENISYDNSELNQTTAQNSASKSAKLDVTFLNQYDNHYEPNGTCGLTSASMMLSFHKKKSFDPDNLYKKFGKYKGQSPEGLASIYKSYGLKGRYTRTGTRQQIKKLLKSGTPVVTHGWFTKSGHVIVITGYDKKGFIVNDPSGKWNGCYKCGYDAWASGKSLNYSYSKLNSSVLGVDGDIWISWVQK